MSVVAVLGVLAAIAVPSFIGYTRRARSSEAVHNLGTLFGLAAALYEAERADQGVAAGVVTSCVAEPTSLNPASPSPVKQRFTANAGFKELGFSIADYVYYGYGISSIGAAGRVSCNPVSGGAGRDVYTFFAHGDLDGDNTQSTFELSVSSNDSNALYHARGIYILKELE